MVRIVDTSVAIKWFVKESGREAALEILADILENPAGYAVPELFYFELSNVLNRLVPSPNAGQTAVLCQILTLGLHRFTMSEELWEQTRFFQGKGLTGYDASYVALARLLKGVWITFDDRAHKKISHYKLSEVLKGS